MRKGRLREIVLYSAFILLALLFLMRIIWIIISSFKNNSELFKWPPTIFLHKFTVINYITAFKKGNFGLFFFNSTFVSVVGTIITVIINTMAGFAWLNIDSREIRFY